MQTTPFTLKRWSGGIKMDPNDCREKGNVLVKEGKMEEALLCYSSGLVFSPNDHRLLSNRSLVQFKLGK